jgi:hypothetical protein
VTAGGAVNGRDRVFLIVLSRGLCVVVASCALVPSTAAAATLDGGSEFWKPAPGTRVARHEVAAAQIGHFAYLLGGRQQGRAQPVGTLERYDVDTGRTALLRSLPVGIEHVGLVPYKGDLLAVGGTPTETTATADVYRYSTKADRWSKITTLPGGPRAGAAVGVIGDRLLVAGGSRGAETLGTLEIYDLARGRWSKGPNLPTPRAHGGGIVLFGRFYVVGGTSAAGVNVPTLERYSSGRWQRMPSMPRMHWGFGLARAAGRIAVVGGIGVGGLLPGLGGLAPQVDLFDPVRGRWSPLPGLRTPRHHLAAVAVGDSIYALEGTTTLTIPTATRIVERLRVPHPTRAQALVTFKASIRGARVSEEGGQVTTAGELRSRTLGAGAIVSHGTASPEATKANWTILTTDGALFARVLLITHLSPGGIALDGIGTITGGTSRYKGARGWFAADETLSSDFRNASVSLDGTIIRPR